MKTITDWNNNGVHVRLEITEGAPVKTINRWQKDIHDLAVKKGWYDQGKRGFPELLMLCVSELSEAMEEVRSGRPIQEIYFPDGKKPEGPPIELADCVIRIMDLCEYYGIDLEEAIGIKHQYNQGRSYRHGGKAF